MELGQRLKQARLDAKMSQRQLCGDQITRNMLSLIENGSAKPSMDTLCYLAGRLGKPISWFLEEGEAPEAGIMEQAREAYRAGSFDQCRTLLQEVLQSEETVFQEKALLDRLCLLNMAEKAIAESRFPYARKLLSQAEPGGNLYDLPEVEHRRQLLLLQAGGECRNLPDIDGELMLRAQLALKNGDAAHCRALLEAMEERTTPTWCFLRGEAAFSLGEYAEAAVWYHRAEEALPEQCIPRLEICYRELEDYKKAYEYAAAGRR